MSEQTQPASAPSATPVPDPAAMFQLISVPPPWLTQEYFRTVLRNYEKDQMLEITSFIVAPATKPGENFASIVFRATVSYKTRGQEKVNIPYIVKVEPFVEGFQKEMMGCGSQFETESVMYTKTLPAMQHLLKSIGDPEIIAPELIFASLEPKIIILQDISPEEYVVEKSPQNVDTVTKVLQKLGKFHALSYFLNDNHDEQISQYNEPFMSEKMKGSLQFINQVFGLALPVVKGWGKDMEVVVDRLLALQPVIIPKTLNHFKANAPGQGYNVLNHGDFHIRNILFKWVEDPERVVDAIRFIDFQFCFYGSPAVDIIWALYFVASTETRDTHREDLIKAYYESFSGTLAALGYLKTPPSLLDLNIELLKKGIIEAFAALGPLPMFFMDIQQFLAESGGAAPTLEDMMTMGKTLLEEPKMKEIIVKLLPKLLYQGNLD